MLLQSLPSFAMPFKSNRSIFYGGLALLILATIVATLTTLAYKFQSAKLLGATGTQNQARLVNQTFESLVDSIDLALQSSANEISRQSSAGLSP